jgi:hypothetical protein
MRTTLTLDDDPLKLKRIHDDLEIEGMGSKADRGVHDQ